MVKRMGVGTILAPGITTAKQYTDKKTGPHCRFCDHKPFCYAHFEYYSKIKSLHSQKTIEDTELIDIIKNQESLTLFMNSVKKRVFSSLKKGEKIKGATLVDKRSAATWAPLAFDHFKNESWMLAEPKLITPAASRKKAKMMNKPLDKIESMIFFISSGKKLKLEETNE